MPEPCQSGASEICNENGTGTGEMFEPRIPWIPLDEKTLAIVDEDLRRLHELIERATKAVARAQSLIEESRLIVQSAREAKESRSILLLPREESDDSDDVFPRD
jgi:hypothetical protein